MNNAENKVPNQKFIKFTNDLGSTFYFPSSQIAELLTYYDLANFTKN
jgi:hypothetical protein